MILQGAVHLEHLAQKLETLPLLLVYFSKPIRAWYEIGLCVAFVHLRTLSLYLTLYCDQSKLLNESPISVI